MNGILAGGFGMRTAGFVISVAAMLLGVESSARASLVGDTVSAVNLFPDTTTVAHNLGTATVGPGVEFEFGLDIDFGSSTLTLSTVAGVDVTFGPDNFNGFRFTDLTNAFRSVSVDPATDVPGFVPSAVTFSGGDIFVNLAGLTINSSTGTEIVLDIPATVPEPSTWAMMLIGFAGLGWLARLSKRRTSPA